MTEPPTRGRGAARDGSVSLRYLRSASSTGGAIARLDRMGRLNVPPASTAAGVFEDLVVERLLKIFKGGSGRDRSVEPS